MNIKKYLAEFLGTMVLVLFGCGTAVVCGGFTGGMEMGFLGVVPSHWRSGLPLLHLPMPSAIFPDVMSTLLFRLQC